MNRERALIVGFLALPVLCIALLFGPIASELEATVASSKGADYATVSSLQPVPPWTTFAEVATGVAGTSSPVRQEHGEACRLWMAVPGGGVAEGDLDPAFCRSVRVGHRHIALYRRGWFSGRLTLTDLIVIHQPGDLSE
jgi:hypothetical protein